MRDEAVLVSVEGNEAERAALEARPHPFRAAAPGPPEIGGEEVASREATIDAKLDRCTGGSACKDGEAINGGAEGGEGDPPNRVLAAYAWPLGLGWATAVVDCESDFDAGADSNWPYVGWWQIDVNHLNPGAALDGFGWTVADLYDSEINTAAAWELYRLQGPGAWPGCG